MTKTGPQTDDIHIVQIALNTSDLPGSLRLYREVFGFSNAGGNALWGEVMRIQGLDPDARSLIWWMVGDVPYFQLEFFHHTKPMQRPLPADWRASDYGWVRVGLAVPNLDRVLTGLRRWGIVPTLAPADASGASRVAFRDPFAGIVVEVGENPRSTGPTATYAATSVADLESARRFYGEVIGAEIEPLERLHSPADEALWGLAGAERDGFIVRFGERVIEVVAYRKPRGRARPDRLISDQGIMNVALGSRNLPRIRTLIERISAAGHKPTRIFEGPETLGTYIVDPGYELEIFSIPESRDASAGFVASGPFLGERPIEPLAGV